MSIWLCTGGTVRLDGDDTYEAFRISTHSSTAVNIDTAQSYSILPPPKFNMLISRVSSFHAYVISGYCHCLLQSTQKTWNLILSA